MLCIRLLALLTILTLWGCTPKVLISTISTEVPENDTVTVVHTPVGAVAKSVTLVATEGGSIAEGTTTMEPDILEFTDSDSGSSITITPGTSIVLNLKGQPSTGYNWIIDQIDNRVLIQEGEPQYLSSNLRGAEQVMVWKFKPVGAGTTVLKLIYTRTFEKDKPPLKIFELSIEVANR